MQHPFPSPKPKNENRKLNNISYYLYITANYRRQTLEIHVCEQQGQKFDKTKNSLYANANGQADKFFIAHSQKV